MELDQELDRVDELDQELDRVDELDRVEGRVGELDRVEGRVGSLLGSLNFKAVVIEVIYDKVPGPRWGFGFVTMSPVSEVEAAAQEFNGYLTLSQGESYQPRLDLRNRGLASENQALEAIGSLLKLIHPTP
ncbi:unnamed protein product [Microthlaspi erraticum]|uniref:RRM domain-containing protein n=1 Tax=Microthlaspi erraticum TaxID=1685480 RepID=A0A6D2JSU1_9BRAS|nr:unnamed protein product [Microthlaspi erraticum]